MGSISRIKPTNLSAKLKQIRLKLNFTLEEMAEKLSAKEITLYRGTIHNYESGDREPPLPVLLKYARLVNVSTDMLIDDDLQFPE
jgi:transcriptional regulator with XRE-family HTH domain